MCWKKLIGLSVMLAILFCCGCSAEKSENIDVFTENFNAIPTVTEKICRSDFTAYVSEDGRDYCLKYGSMLLTIKTNGKNGNIKEISVSCRKDKSRELVKTSREVIAAATGADASASEKIIRRLNAEPYVFSDRYYKSHVFTKEYTFGFVSADAGNKIYISFNEINPVIPTDIPVFRENFTLPETRE